MLARLWHIVIIKVSQLQVGRWLLMTVGIQWLHGSPTAFRYDQGYSFVTGRIYNLVTRNSATGRLRRTALNLLEDPRRPGTLLITDAVGHSADYPAKRETPWVDDVLADPTAGVVLDGMTPLYVVTLLDGANYATAKTLMQYRFGQNFALAESRGDIPRIFRFTRTWGWFT